MANKDFVVQEGSLKYFASKQARVLVATSLGVHKACHIMFHNDGSIFVQFPYFRGGNRGILTNVQLQDPGAAPTTVDLKKNGALASHLPKFSHHADGQAHFSQDRRVHTGIKRQSWPLTGPIGHIFQVDFYYLGGLELLTREDMKPTKLFLPFAFASGLPFAISISGEWRRKKAISANTEPPGGVAGPAPRIKHRLTGEETQVFFLGQPPNYPLRDHILVVSCHPKTIPTGVSGATVVFLGGWDLHEAPEPGATVPSKGFLAAMFPVANYDRLAATMQSIDYQPHLTL